MTARRGLFWGACLVVGVAGAAMARGAMQGPVLGDGLRDRQPGIDSARTVSLLDALAKTDPVICAMIADQIGNFWHGHDDDRVGALADAPRGTAVVIDSLHGRITDPRAFRLLERHLMDDAACTRRVAAKLLGRSAVPTARLVELMQSGAERQQEAAALALGEGERYGARSALAERAGASAEPVAAMAAWALAELHDSVSVDAFIALTRSSHERVRIAAIGGISELGSERGVAPLTQALSDAAPHVRIAAARAFGEIHDLRTAPAALAQAAGSPDEALSVAAIRSLAEIHDVATIDVLAAQVAHRSVEVRRAVVHALGEMASPKAQSALLRALKDSDAEVRQAAAEALGELKGSER